MVVSAISVSAACTVVFNKQTYAPAEVITAEMYCTDNGERNIAYKLNWTDVNGTLLETDSGTTPGTTSQRFYQSYFIPSTHLGYINANLTGTGLEGTDFGNVTGIPANSLLVTNITISGKWLGLVSSAQALVKDDGGKKISGGKCHMDVMSNDKTKVVFSGESIPYDGKVSFSGIASHTEFAEAIDYVVDIYCMCGTNNTIDSCIDEDGVPVTQSIGSSEAPFTMNKWVTTIDNMNITYYNGSFITNATYVHYAGFGKMAYWQSNLTNNYGASLVVAKRQFLINNQTGLTSYSTDQEEFSMKESTSSVTRLHSIELPSTIPTGWYYVRQYYDIYYQDIQVAQYIIKTNAFYVMGTSDSFQLHSVIMDKPAYYTGETMQICGNITVGYDTRIELEISYRYRCGNSSDTTGLSAIDSYTEIRGVNPMSTQLRCANLRIPNTRVLNYMTSSCQAIVTVESSYINTFDNKITVQGPTFNITDFGMYPRYEVYSAYPMIKLSPDWRLYDEAVDSISNNYYRAKINITQISESVLDPYNKVTDTDWDVYLLMTSDMPCVGELLNYTVEYANGSVIDNEVEAKTMHWTDREGVYFDECVIGIENINLSDPDDDYFVAKVWYEDYEARSTEALEGIENKTGTFHMAVDCNTNGFIGSTISCNITAQVESDDLQKEVDFTCDILDGSSQYSSVNFNQMINHSMSTFNKELTIPSNFTTGTYTVECSALYYNLGSRTDTFSDAFEALDAPTSSTDYDNGGLIDDGVIVEGDSRSIKNNDWLYLLLFILVIVGVFLFIRRELNKERGVR